MSPFSDGGRRRSEGPGRRCGRRYTRYPKLSAVVDVKTHLFLGVVVDRGRKPLDRRKVLTGILFVLKTGIPWEDLPQEMGCGSGMSCWRYLKAWQEAGVWDKVHKALLDRLLADGQIDLSAAVVDSSHVRAVGGAKVPVPAL